MVGILQFLTYIVCGLSISNRLLVEHTLMIRLWAGVMIGFAGMMWLVALVSMFALFTPVSHIYALLSMVVLACACGYEKSVSYDWKGLRHHWPILVVILPTYLLCSYLFNTHVLQLGEDGSYNVGQSTFGDLSLHLGIITSIAEQKTFPPEYSIYPGHLLSYPFLIDSLSSSMYLFGTSLRYSVLLPSLVLLLALFVGLYSFFYQLINKQSVALLAFVLFLYNGGFGFAYFMEGARINPENFARMFTDFYHTPTNYNEHNIRWSNTICDMLIPQRTTLAGWSFLVFALWLLQVGIVTEKRKYFVICGVVAGLMPMIHTHSFLALGLVSITWMPLYIIQFRGNQFKQHFIHWACYGMIACLLAVPQLFYWTLRQATEGGFVKLHYDWVNSDDVFIWFWTKNVGIVFLLLLPALIASNKKTILVYSGAMTVFIVSEILIFQPNHYDNNKLLYVWYLFACILVADYMTVLYEKIRDIPGRRMLACMVIFFCTFSGILTVGREVVSSYVLFDGNMVKTAKFIRSETPVDALFISADNHNNVITSLAGRNILVGTGLFLYFHGVNYSERAEDVKIMYQNSELFESLAKKHNIDYVMFSSYERSQFNVDGEFFRSQYPRIFQSGDVEIFGISERAKIMRKASS